MVLDVDPNRRRVSLGIKQCTENPWQAFKDKNVAGATIKGEVKSITEFGLFIGLDAGVDGMVHLSDLAWDKPGEQAIAEYKKGDMVEAKVLDVDIEKERISLGIKQLKEDPHTRAASTHQKGDTVTCTIAAIDAGGISVTFGENLTAFIRKADLARERSEQRPERFAVGDKVDAKITAIDPTSRKISLSIKAREVEEEKQAMSEYGSSDSGASLGDILGAAISRAQKDRARKKTPKPGEEGGDEEEEAVES